MAKSLTTLALVPHQIGVILPTFGRFCGIFPFFCLLVLEYSVLRLENRVCGCWGGRANCEKRQEANEGVCVVGMNSSLYVSFDLIGWASAQTVVCLRACVWTVILCGCGDPKEFGYDEDD